MLADLTPLELITYRAALALAFSDATTGASVVDGLTVRAWRIDPADPEPARRVDEAERSPASGVYGFRSLPGLERYQQGEPQAAASLPFIVTVEDRRGRFLPQTRRYDLPLPQPAVQRVSLFSAPDRPTPTGYGAIRAQLAQTSAPAGSPPQVTASGPAAWAWVGASVPGDNPGDPPRLFHGLADGRGAALVLVPYPAIPAGVLLNEAAWTVAVSVAYEADLLRNDFDLLGRLWPGLDPATRPPQQDIVEAQGAATLFPVVDVVDADAQVYQIVGPANLTEVAFTLPFRRPLIGRTADDAAPDDPLSELLVESA